MKIEEKRKIFLEKLENKYKKIEKIQKIKGSGIFKKFLKILKNPRFYLSFIFLKFNFKRIKEINLFWGKEIDFKFENKEIPFFAITGVLPKEGEYKLTKFFIKNLKESDIFYDVGASYGFYTYLALEFCKEVHSFEPLPEVFKNLKVNLKKEKKVYLNNSALSNKEGKTKIYLPDQGILDRMGGSTIIEESLDKHYYKFSQNLEINTITLNNYLKSHNKPTVIKLDVEGAESFIIEGGYDFFKNNFPLISLEVWSLKEGGEISMRVVEKLRSLGYRSYLINKGGETELAEGDLSKIVEQEGLYDDNFIFKK